MGMQQTGRKRWAWGVAAAVAVLIAGCGGGSDTSAVRVVGDSLADSGTFGFKFTVQGTASDPQPIWTDRVASALGAPSLCARYAGSSASAIGLNPAASTCTSHGVGGGRINPVGSAADSTPISILQQLKDAAAAGQYADTELLLADGGGNDAADLIGAYLSASADGGAAYTALLGELLTPAQVAAAAAAGQTGLAAAGGQYMVALANAFADALTAQALNKGAKRVAVLNMPNVTLTPRFKAVLAGVAASAGGGATGQATAAAVAALAESWVKAFNAQLSARFSTESRVAVVDFFTSIDQVVKNPASFGLTNASTPACPVTGTDSMGLPAYTIATCTASSLSANPPAGASGGAEWWKTWYFSDNFHGTPRANQIIADLVLTKLAEKGWK